MNLLKVSWIFLPPAAETSLNEIGKAMAEILVTSGMANSKSEGRRAIEGGGIQTTIFNMQDSIE